MTSILEQLTKELTGGKSKFGFQTGKTPKPQIAVWIGSDDEARTPFYTMDGTDQVPVVDSEGVDQYALCGMLAGLEVFTTQGTRAATKLAIKFDCGDRLITAIVGIDTILASNMLAVLTANCPPVTPPKALRLFLERGTSNAKVIFPTLSVSSDAGETWQLLDDRVKGEFIAGAGEDVKLHNQRLVERLFPPKPKTTKA
jgi:hypothetical protein